MSTVAVSKKKTIADYSTIFKVILYRSLRKKKEILHRTTPFLQISAYEFSNALITCSRIYLAKRKKNEFVNISSKSNSLTSSQVILVGILLIYGISEKKKSRKQRFPYIGLRAKNESVHVSYMNWHLYLRVCDSIL